MRFQSLIGSIKQSRQCDWHCGRNKADSSKNPIQSQQTDLQITVLYTLYHI